MAGGKDETALGSKRKRQSSRTDEEEEAATDTGAKRVKQHDDAEDLPGQQEEGSHRQRSQGEGPADDEKAVSKSGLTIRWKVGASSAGQKAGAAESDKPGAAGEELLTDDELRSSRSQRHKKQFDSDSQPKKPARKDKGRQTMDEAGNQEEGEEEADDGPPVFGPDGEPLEVLPGKEKQVHEGPAVVRQKVQAPHESVEAVAAGASSGVENLSEGQKPVAPPGAELASIAELGQPGQDTGKPDAPVQRLTREVYRVPAHAGWFRWEHIHELERRGVPEFFNGRAPSKTAKTYKEYRDFMISKYREEPKKYLTFTEVRKMLVGDVNALRRIFEFLDHWGLVNYQASADPRQRPPVWEGVSATLVQAAPSGIRIVAPAIAPQDALYKFDAPRAKPAPVASRPSVFPAATAAATANIAGGSSSTVPAVEYHCDRCGAACSARRYHCQKQADFDLCPDCFAEGKFGPGMTTADFIRMDAADAAVNDDGGWSDQETLLLLEGLELFGDNWQEIAEHVSTKSRAQCILHFIQMPIEDPFLEELEANSTVTTVNDDSRARGRAAEKGTLNGGSAQDAETASELIMQASGGVEGEPLTPFADAGNPVMAQVAFLAAMVGPRVAAAAAQAALAALTQEDPTIPPPPASDPTPTAPSTLPTKVPFAVPASEAPSVDATPRPVEPLVPGSEVAVPEAGPSGPTDTVMTSAEEAAPGKPESNSKDGADAAGEPVGSPMQVDKAEGVAGHVDGDAQQAAPVATPLQGAAPTSAAPPPAAAPGPPSAAQVRAAAATALAAAAVKAKLLADQEEREISRLVTLVVEAQLKKLEIKLKHFDELEEMLEREKDQIEKARQQVYAERVRLAASRLAPSTPKAPVVAAAATQVAAGTVKGGPSSGPGLAQAPRTNPVPAGPSVGGQ